MFRLIAVGFSSGTVQRGLGSLIEPSRLEQMRRNNTLTWLRMPEILFPRTSIVPGIPLTGTVFSGLYLEPFL